MDIGIRIPVYRRWCRADEVRAIARLAEDAGYASLWVQDHVVAPVGESPGDAPLVDGVDSWMTDAADARKPMTVLEYYAGDDWWLDPYVVWAFLAASTSRVRLASDVVVLPYRNALVQAKMLGTLDVLSNGRMLLGTGSGHVAAESAALGLDFAARGRMHDEYLRVIRLLLTEEEATFKGEFYDFARVRSLIRPVQQPCPPIYVGGNGARSIRRAVELGDGWLPSSPDPAGLAAGIEALRAACEEAGRVDVPPVAVSIPSKVRLRPGESSDEAITLLKQYEAVGVSHVALGLAMPSASVYLDQIERFAAEVLPAFGSPPAP
jgi:probable F420-dependent oxidoreductase